jgi:serine O-acetyltransferase
MQRTERPRRDPYRDFSALGRLGILPTMVELLLSLRRYPILRDIARAILRGYYSLMIPNSVVLGEGTRIIHSNGVNFHPKVVIGRNVHIHHEVSIGRANIEVDEPEDYPGVVVEDDVILGAHVKIYAPEEGLTVGRGTLVAACALLLESTGEYEVWAGLPARKIGDRERPDAPRSSVSS